MKENGLQQLTRLLAPYQEGIPPHAMNYVCKIALCISQIFVWPKPNLQHWLLLRETGPSADTLHALFATDNEELQVSLSHFQWLLAKCVKHLRVHLDV